MTSTVSVLLLLGVSAFDTTPYLTPGLPRVAPRAAAVAERTDSLMTWSLSGNAVRPGVRVESMIRRVRVGGQPRLRVVITWHDTSGAIVSRTTSDADAATLMPIACRVRALRDSASLAIVDGRVVGWSALSRGQPRQFDEAIEPGTIAPELDAAAVATLPLESVTQGTLDVLGAFGGVNRRLVTVVGPDTLDAAGRVRDCWVVRVWSGVETEAKVTMWIDRNTRRVWQERGDFANFSWFHRVTNP